MVLTSFFCMEGMQSMLQVCGNFANKNCLKFNQGRAKLVVFEKIYKEITSLLAD